MIEHEDSPIAEITRQIAEFVAELGYEDLPTEVVDRAKLLILDIAGSIVRARHDAESTPSLLAAVERLGLSDGLCTVIGDGGSYAPTAAALLNGTLAHSLDFDDTASSGPNHVQIHFGIPIFHVAEVEHRFPFEQSDTDRRDGLPQNSFVDQPLLAKLVERDRGRHHPARN